MANDSTTQVPRGSDGDARRFAHEMRDVAKDQAGALWSDAKRTARSKVSEQKEAAASGIHDFAAALHAAADQLQGERHEGIARLAQSAAGGLDRMSGSLARKDLDALVRDAESFARRQPLAFFATAAVAGFLAVRFLKSSERDPARDSREDDEHAHRYANDMAAYSAHDAAHFDDERMDGADFADVPPPAPRTPI